MLTTIAVTVATKKRLDSLLRGGEDRNSVIVRLLDAYEELQNLKQLSKPGELEAIKSRKLEVRLVTR
jgi:hypothetical protein